MKADEREKLLDGVKVASGEIPEKGGKAVGKKEKCVVRIIEQVGNACCAGMITL